MVSARGVIACGFRRPVTEEHGTGAGDAIDQRTGVAGLNNQVLRAVLVRDGDALLERIRHDQAAGRERLACRVGSRQFCQLAFYRFAHALCHVGVRRQQNHLGIGTVFGLREQVRGHKVRRRAAVGNHQHFRRARRHVNRRTVQTLADLAFGFSDVGIPRPKNLIDFRHGFGAKREGGDGLRPACFKDVLHAAQFCRVEDLIGNRRWRAEHHFLTTGDTRRRGEHQDGGKQRGGATGNVESDGGHRARHLLAAHARQGFDVHHLQFLRGVEGVDVFDRHGHRLFDVIAKTVAGVINFLRRHFQRTDVGFVKPGAVFTQCVVAAGFHVIQDFRHGAGNAVRSRNGRARQQFTLLFSAAGIPVDDCIKAHITFLLPDARTLTGHCSRNYSIIFSIGSTRMELAPRAFSFSMVSQNRVSLLTICIATRC
ncbi:hypothetical protein D3C72_974130 [compost metagenome]